MFWPPKNRTRITLMVMIQYDFLVGRMILRVSHTSRDKTTIYHRLLCKISVISAPWLFALPQYRGYSTKVKIGSLFALIFDQNFPDEI